MINVQSSQCCWVIKTGHLKDGFLSRALPILLKRKLTKLIQTSSPSWCVKPGDTVPNQQAADLAEEQGGRGAARTEQLKS